MIDNRGYDLQKKTYRPCGQEIVVLGTDSFPFGFQSKRREASLDVPDVPFPGAPVDFGVRARAGRAGSARSWRRCAPARAGAAPEDPKA